MRNILSFTLLLFLAANAAAQPDVRPLPPR